TCKWSAVDGAMSYTVQMRSGGGSWYDVPGGTTTGTWITVGNLTSCKYYEWRVRSNCYGYGYSNWCNTMSFTCTCGHGCHAPEWVYTAGISPNSGTCHWAPVSGADSYVVEWRVSGGTWNALAPVTNPYVELTGLSPTTTYEWHVKCHCPSGYSDWSSTAYFNTSSGASCGLPFWRYTLPITDSTATFNWAPVPGAVDYIVQIHAQGNNPWQDVLGSPTTNTSITAKGLAPNTAYEWRMQVDCGNGAYSYWLSSILFYTGATAGCGTPSWLYADNISLNSATLNWAAVPGALFYTVDIRVTPSGAWKPIHNNPVSTNSVTIDSLKSYTTYDWRVKAHCAGGSNSYDSYGPPFSTNTSLSCRAPDGLSVNNITETAGTFKWNSVAGALGYEVQSRLPNENWIDFAGGILNDTTVAVTGFTPNTSYEWRVRTKCDTSLYSNWSSVSIFKTIGTNPLNEDCATATELTVGTSCVPTFASNVDAKASTPAPVGGCYVSGYKDVWFKFTMPDVPNPAVTIRTTAGSLANAVMEVYSGTDCGIMSFIACEDNNDNGNGSSMPVINLTGTPKANIWVRVWGYDGATGTFSICVFSGISVNYAVVENTENVDQGESTEVLENALVPTIEGANQPD
ncbi:MAG TPA: fibronectin type III domain-containing protein, partial [Saprospiraceae bacterium]|nr:fibronectin type III domain-containing protein [Saprospiraceae bacterium]